MANHKSAEKRARQSEKRRVRNRASRTRVRSAVKSVMDALEGGDASGAKERLRGAERELRKAASKGLMKRETASRTVSRLSKRVGRAG